jgi:hypothetical protein
VTALAFKKATRKQTKARIAIMGPTGAGKTKWALRIAHGLGGRIAVIDTENRSASLYAGDHGIDFDSLELDPDTEGGYDPRNYVDAIEMAERAGYDVIVIDSLTHAWTGSGGALEQVDKANNKFAAWKDVTPIQNALTDSITHCKAHVIATLRSKMEYVLEEQVHNGKKKQVPVRVGLAPIQRAGMEYEFSVIGECDLETHALKLTKTRVSAVDGKTFAMGQVDVLARSLREFHDSGEVAPAAPAAEPQQPAAAPLPTKTAKNYQDAQWADVPFASLPHSALIDYLTYYTERLPTLTQANHRKAVESTIAAAQAEAAGRLAREVGEPPETFPEQGASA